ncbi:MAG: roadblock/LC7 domain-containing protein [Desulfomonile tiedjei]|nr:roadblock/LC7 domain-containing protein [Desulfomonile tiedjei]
MTAQDLGIEDIFQGAEKVEIFGKLPALLWAYIDTGRQVIQDLQVSPGKSPESLHKLQKLLEILNSAAEHLGNKELKGRLDPHSQMLSALTSGETLQESLVQSFTSCLAKLEEVAGQRTPSVVERFLGKDLLDQELDKVERIKAGRSADIVVSIDVLNDVRNYLSSEVMTEGISSILVIDNAGSLIVNMGNKIELDAVSLAAVAAANFAATEQIARLIGERDFVLLFYKGHSESFHFSRVGDEYIIVTIFNNALSLGLVRLKIAEVVTVLAKKLPKREG